MLCDTCQHNGSTTQWCLLSPRRCNQRAQKDDICHDRDTK